MKVDVVKDGSVIKSFELWRDGEKRDEPEKSFSFQLLEVLREPSRKIDIMDVRELIQLGADPNYKIMVHTDEDVLNRQIDQYIENEIPGMPQMRVWTQCTIAYAINMQDSRPDIIEAILKSNKVDPNLDISDVGVSKGPTTFYFCAITKMKDVKVHERILQKMFDDGADVNVLNSSGNNVIHEAIERESLEIIPKLIELGVDPFLKNKYGETPYDMVNRDTLRGLEHQRTPDPPELKAKKERLKSMLIPPSPPKSEKGKFELFRKKPK